jgi:membrane associated rhomboid family serine protease
MPDRFSGRSPAPAWMRPFTERLSPTIRNLVVALSVMFGLFIMASGLRAPISAHLALGPAVAWGELWQPATSLFVHLDLWSFVFDLIGLWFVGATIERALGRRRFLLLFFGSGLAANVTIALLALGLAQPGFAAGCGDSVLALFVALGVLYGPSPVRVWGRLVLPANVLTGILVGMAVLAGLLQGAWASLGGTLVAVGLAYFLSGGKVRTIVEFLARLRRGRRSVLRVFDGGRGKKNGKYVN